MTLDEAILCCLDLAKDCKTESEKQHAQFAHWLQSYKDKLKDTDTTPKMTLYDANRMLYSQLPRLIIDTEHKEKLCKYISKKDNTYYMLMCKELSYFTCFKIENIIKGTHSLIEVITEHIDGYVVDIGQREDGNMEIWMHMNEDNEAHMFMLFPYDWGVIEC